MGNLIIDLESRWYRVGNAGGGSEDRHATREVLSVADISGIRTILDRGISSTYLRKYLNFFLPAALISDRARQNVEPIPTGI